MTTFAPISLMLLTSNKKKGKYDAENQGVVLVIINSFQGDGETMISLRDNGRRSITSG
jgi:hypothetical protein